MSPMCVASTLLLRLSHVCLQWSHLWWFSTYMGQDLVTLPLVGQFQVPWVWIGSHQAFAEMLSQQPQVTVCFSLRDFHCLVGLVDQMSNPSSLLGPQGICVCVVIFPSSQGKGHLRVMLDPVGDSCMMPYLWNCFRWTSAKGEFTGDCKDGYMVLASFTLVCCGSNLECLRKFLPRLGWMAGR